MKLPWSSVTWSLSYSESQLESSLIYTFTTYGSPQFLYLIVMSVSNGSVVARYKSSTSCTFVYGSGSSGDYMIASAWDKLLLFNKATNTFSILSFSGSSLYGIGFDTATSR